MTSTGCWEDRGTAQNGMTGRSVNRLERPAVTKEAQVRRTAVRGTQALRSRNVDLLIELAPPPERPQLRARLGSEATRSAVFDPGGWRGGFVGEWDGRAYEVTYPRPDEAIVTLGEHQGVTIGARVIKRDDAWYFQGLTQVR